MKLRAIRVAGLLFAGVLCLACNDLGTKTDDGVVVSEKADVLNSTALVATKLAQLKKGDKVEIYGQASVNGVDYVKILVPNQKEASPKAGWMEARHLISQKILDQCESLAKAESGIPPQVQGRLKQQSNLRLKPSRDSEVVALLKTGTIFEVVRRERVPYKPPTGTQAPGSETAPPSEEEGKGKFDDWYFVRFPEESVFPAGWLYAGWVEITAPEPLPSLVGPGRRAAAVVEIGKSPDRDGQMQKNYVVLDKQNFNSDALTDFDRIYVVAWDAATDGYGSVYIESGLRGTYPILYSRAGDRTEFSVPLLDKEGKATVTKYEAVRNALDGKIKVVKLTQPQPPSKAATKKK